MLRAMMYMPEPFEVALALKGGSGAGPDCLAAAVGELPSRAVRKRALTRLKRPVNGNLNAMSFLPERSTA
jgi:hypothetical protein